MTEKWGTCLGLKQYGNLAGVTCWGRVQRDSKVGGNWNCYSKGNMLREGPEGQQSRMQLALLQQGNRRGNMLGRIQSDIKVGCMIGIDPIKLV